ncbi:DUF1289 domain-containing protein [Mangrovibrevibacter kandeliae]|uniref:DUF1289 domain-containing protein n=1 Tax=Mangrovibrevibacter kandeliae TaxID=2968473 RepID=UPI002117CDC0|nr:MULTISPECIES: DUF1289 domain-containing protein [unclassified Aurantimonas]MCQ8781265.1 DUF1289 domain-containing protein [Aurantimonas sp. CSK15Z-1]MCW4114047.1 DUF1289 domain-containing protein [Aurantimonas sp. MSK8Z-1]
MAIDSPCTRVCVIDPASGLCRGCRRTIEEIASWTRLTEAGRRAVLADLPNRLVRPKAEG